MNSSRRTFIKTSAIALAATAIINKSVFASALKPDLVGVQLYSIREDMKEDPLGSLKQIAGMGYKNIEHANYVEHKFSRGTCCFYFILKGYEIYIPFFKFGYSFYEIP